MEYDDWAEKLNVYFDRALQNDSNWQSIKAKLKIGDLISGIVICRAPFGAWIDINAGFPALLEIIYIEGLIPSDYQSGNWCKEGSTIEAYVLGFVDDGKQIYLTQKQVEQCS